MSSASAHYLIMCKFNIEHKRLSKSSTPRPRIYPVMPLSFCNLGWSIPCGRIATFATYTLPFEGSSFGANADSSRGCFRELDRSSDLHLMPTGYMSIRSTSVACSPWPQPFLGVRPAPSASESSPPRNRPAAALPWPQLLHTLASLSAPLCLSPCLHTEPVSPSPLDPSRSPGNPLPTRPTSGLKPGPTLRT